MFKSSARHAYSILYIICQSVSYDFAVTYIFYRLFFVIRQTETSAAASQIYYYIYNAWSLLISLRYNTSRTLHVV